MFLLCKTAIIRFRFSEVQLTKILMIDTLSVLTQQLTMYLMINTLSIVTKYSKLSPVREYTDITSPPYTYTFPPFSIQHPLPLSFPLASLVTVLFHLRIEHARPQRLQAEGSTSCILGTFLLKVLSTQGSIEKILILIYTIVIDL